MIFVCMFILQMGMLKPVSKLEFQKPDILLDIRGTD